MNLTVLALVIISLCLSAILAVSYFRTGTDAQEAKPIKGRLSSILRRLYGVPAIFLGLCMYPADAMRFVASHHERPHLGEIVNIVISLLAMGICLYVGFCWFHGRTARFSLPPRMRQFFHLRS
jgi:hypothetical protein